MTKNPGREMSDEEAIELVADSVIENVRKVQNDIADPFEVYTYHVQAKIFSDQAFFKKHCLEGYHSLIKEMKSE